MDLDRSFSQKLVSAQLASCLAEALGRAAPLLANAQRQCKSGVGVMLRKRGTASNEHPTSRAAHLDKSALRKLFSARLASRLAAALDRAAAVLPMARRQCKSREWEALFGSLGRASGRERRDWRTPCLQQGLPQRCPGLHRH